MSTSGGHSEGPEAPAPLFTPILPPEASGSTPPLWAWASAPAPTTHVLGAGLGPTEVETDSTRPGRGRSVREGPRGAGTVLLHTAEVKRDLGSLVEGWQSHAAADSAIVRECRPSGPRPCPATAGESTQGLGCGSQAQHSDWESGQSPCRRLGFHGGHNQEMSPEADSRHPIIVSGPGVA